MESSNVKGKSTIESIVRVKESMGILENKIEELICHERYVQAQLQTTEALYGQKTKMEVELWLKNVRRIKNEMPDIRQKLEELRWFNFYKRMNLAQWVEEKIKEVVELRENGQFLNELFVNSLPSTTKKFPPVKLVGEKTALRILKMIEECLMDDEVRKIGVFGMGGSGKTTIMTQIYNKIKNASTFDGVIWVTVSRDSYLEKLQYDISNALHLDLFNNDAIGRSMELFGAFNRTGRFLLILDDMWNAFPLEKIGIPEPDEENKCKIVWTTRSKKVCQGMGSHKPIKVEGLTEDESWTLFQEKLGANNLSPELEPIAKAVVKECDGLPLAIITVGAAMRDVDDIRTWRAVLDDLRNSRTTEIIEGIENDVFTCLKFSFDKLRTQRLRDCFLYCAMYPKNYQIDCIELIEYWMADGLVDDIEDRDEGFDMGYTIINELKDACMLESVMLVSDEMIHLDCVRMHGLLKNLAINITRKSSQFVIRAAFIEKQFSWDENVMTGAIRVSLMSSNIGMLSCQPKSCPELSTLLLQYSRLKDIHHSFFEHMHKLRVLDLSRTNIMCLPESISNLRNLRGLWLRECEQLIEVSSLANLKELMVLDLFGTSISCLPKGLDGSTNLRCLDLSCTKELETFPAGIISNLLCLEELYLIGCKWEWLSKENGGACVEEMLSLTHLRKLYVRFADLNAFNWYVRSGHWSYLKYFYLLIGDQVHGYYDDRTHMVKISSSNECLSSIVLPDSILQLDIRNCPFLKYVCSVGPLQALQNLECISVDSCGIEMEEMFVEIEDMGESSDDIDNTITLPRLRTFNLCNLPKLKSISKRIFVCNSLENISVRFCPKLKKLPFSINSIPPALKSIRGSNEWWDSLEWDNSDIQSHLQLFFSSDDADDNEEEKRGTKRKAEALM